MTTEELILLTVSFALKMLAAVTAIGILAACAAAGAWLCGIDIKEAVDRVEKNPMAFSILVTGHFIGAALVISSAW